MGLNFMTSIKEIQNIHQQGPTCGIYAVAMILKALNYKSLDKEDPQDLASKIFDIATSEKDLEKISNIGEIFAINKMGQLLEEVKNNLLICDGNGEVNKENLEYVPIEFQNEFDMTTKIKAALDEGKYILFPYHTKNLNLDKSKNTNVDMKHMHWCVIYNFDEHKGISAEEGNNKKKLIDIDAKRLYNSNQSLYRDFNWCKYLSPPVVAYFEKIYRKFFFDNKHIRDSIWRLTDKNIETLKKNRTIKLSLKGEMIAIWKETYDNKVS